MCHTVIAEKNILSPALHLAYVHLPVQGVCVRVCVCVYIHTVQWVAIVWILTSVALSGQLKWEEPQTMVKVLYCQKHWFSQSTVFNIHKQRS